MFAYLIILTSAMAGMAQAHWLSIVAGGCLLSLLLISEKAERSPTGAIQVRGIDIAIASAAFAHGTIAACLAFAAGRASAWLWGL